MQEIRKVSSKGFFARIEWFIIELVKMYSGSEKSYFSKKRIEGGVAFIILQWGMVHWLVINIEKVDYMGIGAWAIVEAGIAGFTLKQIQKEKIDTATA